MAEKAENIRYLFGTDGVRDVANRGVMIPEMALRLGRAFVLFLTEKGVPRPVIVVGRDTRQSGQMIEVALEAGLTSAGAEVIRLDVIPTPGVSFAVRDLGADAAAVISASHNPAEYNGIKFLDSQGYKLSDSDEIKIEECLSDNILDEWRPTGRAVGRIRDEKNALDRYVAWLKNYWDPARDRLPSLVVDCAHGAAFSVAQSLFPSIASESLDFIGVAPDGLNINESVGVMHMKHLGERVLQAGSRLGIAFDGDADRVLFIDPLGRTIDGDIVLWVIGRWLARKGELGQGVVATVMSNLALEERLAEEDVAVFRCPVGDRYVLETMREKKSLLGGEQSGHIILGDHVTTGDGPFTALAFLRAVHELGEDTATLVDRFGRYPQILKNVKVTDKVGLMVDVRLQAAIAQACEELGDQGRIFVRASGTEPMVRVLVEAREELLLTSVSEKVLAVVHHLSSTQEECFQ